MKNILPSDKIYVKDSNIPNSGRGVFATKEIKKGELIERCPIIEIPDHDPSNPSEGILITYIYYFGEEKGQAVPLGYGAIYNHTRTPNATYKIKQKEEVIDFLAIENIKKDEEITVNYNHANPKDTTPMWFE